MLSHDEFQELIRRLADMPSTCLAALCRAEATVEITTDLPHGGTVTGDYCQRHALEILRAERAAESESNE